jgi:hypothetical protein
MSMQRRRVAVAALGAIVALLVPVGVLAATSAGPFPDRTVHGGRVGAAGLGLQGVDAERSSSPSSTVATTVAAAAPTAPSTGAVPPSTATSLPVPPTTGPTSRTTVSAPPLPQLPATAPALLPGLLPAPGKVAPTSWSVEQNGIRLRMAVETTGLTATFVVDISSVEPCCATGLSFGDGPDYAKVGPAGSCAGPADVTGAVVHHTYAVPGVYKVRLVTATFPCKVTVVDGKPVPPPITGADITACVAVGAGFVAYDGQC